MKKIISYENGTDCFGNTGPISIDHVWPLEKGGADIKENRIILASTSNNEKSNKTKGNINYKRFSVLKQLTKDGHVYGILRILIDEKWVEVESNVE